jgi:hypothetical protein
MKDLHGTSKTVFSGYAKLALAAFATLGAAGLAGACSSDSSPSSGDGGSSGAHSGSGSGSGSASGGSGSSGSTSRDAGDAGGNDGEAGDDSSGDAAPTYVPETCTAACMMATGCPTAQCYAASANPIASPAIAGVPETLLYPKYAHDGLLNTRYSTGAPAVGMEWFQVDLCQTASVNGVTLDDSTSMTDQAVAYTVQVSLDGTTWSTVATGSSIPAMDSGAGTTDSGAGADSSVSMDATVATDSSVSDADSSVVVDLEGAPPAEASVPPAMAPAVLTIPFAPVMARYVRVNQTGTLPTSARTGMPHWWSIDEFSVACPGGGDAAPASDSSSDAALDVASQ